MPRRALPLAVVALLAVATPAFAVKEWYVYYLDATEEDIRAGRYEEAKRSLEEAIRLKPTPALNERTYGLEFIDYLPYYYLGLCHLRTGDLNTALQMFNIEVERGVVKRSRVYKDLLRFKTEAENARNEKVARMAREEVERLVKEGADLARGARYDEALERLAKASIGAGSLDPATLQRVVDLREKIRAAKREVSESAARAARIEQALAEGRRLLDEGKATEAHIRFQEVLGLDPRNAAAAEGQRDAQERLRASSSRAGMAAAFERGKALFDAGKYEEALKPLTDATADPGNAAARDLLAQAQKFVEGVKRARDQRVRIDTLLADAERLIGDRKFSAATVKLGEALELDPENVKARERLGFAERMTGEELFQRWLPNQAPALIFFEPQTRDLEGPTVQAIGAATDDRGVARIEFRLGGKLVGEQVPALQAESGEIPRNVRFAREFPLEKGPNEITVTVLDTSGVRTTETLRLNRRLRWFETQLFLPSAFGLAVTFVGAGFAVQRARRRRAVRNRFNPYIAGAPVLSDDMFFGRGKLLTRMMNVLHHNSLMITGERRIGKTTFLYHLKKALETDEGGDYRFFPVFTDLQGVPESGFFHAVMTDVVEGLKLASTTQDSLRFRVEEDAYDGRDFGHDLQRVIEELKSRTPKRVKLALLIDEVDALNEYSERINQRLRSIFMKTFSEHLVAIMSGVGIKRVWNSEGSPWYNFFDEIELTAFTRDEAEALIRTPVEGYFRYDAEAAEKILAWSELKPYVIQKFCIHAVNRMLEEGRTVVTARDVESVHETVRFDGPGETAQGASSAERRSAEVVAD
jgi:tetratricopeptide (TPR) repeat protein